MGEVGIEFGGEGIFDQLAIGQSNRQGVQPEAAGKTGNRSKTRPRVALVANHSVAEALQVPPDLVAPPCLDLDLEEREGADPFDAVVAGHGGEGVAPAGVLQGPSDDALLAGAAVDQGDVDPMGFVAGQPAGDQGPGVGFGRAEDQSGGVGVQSMDGPGLGRQIGLSVQPRDEVRFVGRTRGVYSNARGFVNRDESVQSSEDPRAVGGDHIGRVSRPAPAAPDKTCPEARLVNAGRGDRALAPPEDP